MTESSSAPLKETPLVAAHRAVGARMVPFAGYSMPVQYREGIIAEHKWTRENAGLFDVSHMGPSFLALGAPTGDVETDHAAVSAIMESLTPGDIAGLKPGQLRYTLLLNAEGGILDDLMVGRPAEGERAGELYVVVNAGTKVADFARIAAAAGSTAVLTQSDHGLLALQGPAAVEVVRAIMPEASGLSFMTFATLSWDGVPVLVSRSGYTGEDGFEILVPADRAMALWQRLLADPRVRPIGLGARDSLRLEAGLPLYGHDLDETTTPVEANLAFAVSKRRRREASFPGAARIAVELANGPGRLRVGLLPTGKVPVREGAPITDGAGRRIGVVTSGGFGPTLNRPVAMGYVEAASAANGTPVAIEVRGQFFPAHVAAMPLVPHRYVRNP